MLTVHKIAKSYGVEVVLADVSFSVGSGERVGLVGPNGGGKTTLLRIIAGIETADGGHVRLSPGELRLGYLPQGLAYAPSETVDDFLARGHEDSQALASELARLAEALMSDPHNRDMQRTYDSVLARLAAVAVDGGLSASTLAMLGLDAVALDTPVSSLSGGQKSRLSLAGVLRGDPQLLLLDEPTNHLDIAMLEWLENWLADYRGAALIVSHDRTFLDHTVSRILDLDLQTHSVRGYACNYTAYVAQKTAERERQWGQWHDEQAEIRRLRQDIAATKEQALWVERTTTSRQPTVRRYAKKVARKAVSREKKLDRFAASDERVDKPKSEWQMKLAFGEVASGGQDVLVTEALSVGYGTHVLLRDLNLCVRHGERIVLTGPNGAGKTTLLRTIDGVLAPLAGVSRLGASVRTGYMAQEQEGLDPALDALVTIRAAAQFSETDARNFLHFFLFSNDDVFTPIGLLSFGERSRLTLACLVARGCNFLLLDEPINHLDVPSRERFEQALAGFEGTILAVTHDRYFIDRFAARVWRCGGTQVWED
jgi:ATP-binding cassette, subfamily F, member 3